MHVKNAKDWQIEQAALNVGVRLYNFRSSGKGYAFQLHPGDKDQPGVSEATGRKLWTAKYARKSQWSEISASGREYCRTISSAICWHGHRDFFRALYALAPEARIKTAFTTYKNAEHFEESYRDTYYGKSSIGGAYRCGFVSRVLPYADACGCQE
jgi:hypothetical protein